MDSLNITFFFPYKDVSGVPILFGNMANALSRKGHNISIIDYKNGILWNQVQIKEIKKIRFKDGSLIKPDNESILVLQCGALEAIRPELKFEDEQKLFFWHLHPNNYKLNNYTNLKLFDSIINSFRIIEKNRIRNTLLKLNETKGIAFMDGVNYESTNELYSIEMEKNLLPIIIDENRKQNKVSKKIKNLINISYIGRICDFKYYPLLKLIECLEKIESSNFEHNFKLFVIGDGPLMNELVEIKENSKLDIELLGTIKNEEMLNELRIRNININFSMGTSALESSFLGIPTVICDFFYKSYNLFPTYKWIYHLTDFNLTKEIKKKDFRLENYKKFVSIIKEYIEDSNRVNNKTKAYYNKNFSSEEQVDKFELFIKYNSLKYKSIEKYSNKTILRKLYNFIKYKLYR